MKRIFAAILVFVLGACAVGGFAIARTNTANAASAQRGSEFFAIDVIVDSGAAGLGAYQVEITPRRGTHAQLVGIEGGDTGAFAEPPAYDPEALHAADGFDRVILAAFTTDRLVPVGQVRVARLHFHADTGTDSQFTARLVAAGGANATGIPAAVRLAPVRIDTDVHSDNNNGEDDREGAP